jgi:hypothetical protein
MRLGVQLITRSDVRPPRGSGLPLSRGDRSRLSLGAVPRPGRWSARWNPLRPRLAFARCVCHTLLPDVLPVQDRGPPRATIPRVQNGNGLMESACGADPRARAQHARRDELDAGGATGGPLTRFPN